VSYFESAARYQALTSFSGAVLAIETAATMCSVAYACQGKLIARDVSAQQMHSALILNLIADVLAQKPMYRYQILIILSMVLVLDHLQVFGLLVRSLKVWLMQ
jgi:hypothetical protein